MTNHFGFINEFVEWPNFHFLASRYNKFKLFFTQPQRVTIFLK